MPLNAHFNYDEVLFSPPAPAISIEVRSPAFAMDSYAEHILALIDTGAYGTAIPWSVIERLNLQKVDEAEVKGYDQRDYQLKPVFSAHISIQHLKPLIIRAIPIESDDYAIIGRDIINKWQLDLNGPGLVGSIRVR